MVWTLLHFQVPSRTRSGRKAVTSPRHSWAESEPRPGGGGSAASLLPVPPWALITAWSPRIPRCQKRTEPGSKGRGELCFQASHSSLRSRTKPISRLPNSAWGARAPGAGGAGVSASSRPPGLRADRASAERRSPAVPPPWRKGRGLTAAALLAPAVWPSRGRTPPRCPSDPVWWSHSPQFAGRPASSYITVILAGQCSLLPKLQTSSGSVLEGKDIKI